MIAKIAYLTTPEDGRYMLNFQAFGSDELVSIEVAPNQLSNILSCGVALMLRQSFHRVPVSSQTERNADERAASGA